MQMSAETMRIDRLATRFLIIFFFFQAEDGIRYLTVTGVQTCALPIFLSDAPTMGGGRELENRYGRDRCRSICTISAFALVYPPAPPPSALPSVPVRI